MASSSVSQDEKFLSPISPIPKSKIRNRPRSYEFSSSLPERTSHHHMSADLAAENTPKARAASREKRTKQPPASTSCMFPNPASVSARNKLRDRRRLREKRKSPGVTYVPSTEGTSTGEEESDAVFKHDQKTLTGGATKQPPDHPNPKIQDHHQHFRNHANSGLRHQHEQLSKRLSPANALLSCRFRGSKSQSDLDADCEDNTADYDSASMISASETAGGQSQFFIPDPSVADRDFQAHVQEIRMAGMQQLTASGDPQTDEDQLSGSSSDDMEEDLGKILEKERREKSTLLQQLGQQEDRIVHLERMVNELTKRLQESCLENQTLRAQNASLQGPKK